MKFSFKDSSASVGGASSTSRNLVGKVYGVVMNENTPSHEMFLKAGGWSGLGSIFYLNYEQSKDVNDIDLNQCSIAKPLYPNQKYYPLVGELVELTDLPSAGTQILDTASNKYYTVSISIWNNNHHNSQPSSDEFVLGKTFKEKQNISTLQPFEGDYILESRFGSGIRFGSTCKDINVPNYWSKVGEDGSPIIMIGNGYNFDPKSTTPYTEDVNKDGSTIILSSTQAIPLRTDKIKINALTKPIDVDKYSNAQVIFSADRIVLNSKKDDVLIFGKTNIELYTKNVINLNAEERTHINSPRVFLGTKKDGKLPDEPLLLGDKTVSLLEDAFKEIINFANTISTAVASPQGTPLLQINQAAQLLSTKLEAVIQRSENIKSKQNYTV